MDKQHDLNKTANELCQLIREGNIKLQQYYASHVGQSSKDIQPYQKTLREQIIADHQKMLNVSKKLITKKIHVPRLYDIFNVLSQRKQQLTKFSKQDNFPSNTFVGRIKEHLDQMKKIYKKTLDLLKWDCQLLEQLYGLGLSDETIQKLMDINLRKNTIKYLTDNDIEGLKIKLLGDKFILKQYFQKKLKSK